MWMAWHLKKNKIERNRKKSKEINQKKNSAIFVLWNCPPKRCPGGRRLHRQRPQSVLKKMKQKRPLKVEAGFILQMLDGVIQPGLYNWSCKIEKSSDQVEDIKLEKANLKSFPTIYALAVFFLWKWREIRKLSHSIPNIPRRSLALPAAQKTPVYTNKMETKSCTVLLVAVTQQFRAVLGYKL